MRRAVAWLGLLGLAAVIAGWPVSTRRGVNGQVDAMRIPLWVKTAEFLARDYHYRRLARDITAGLPDDQAKALAVFAWVRAHVRVQPEELPVIDDHIYSIIVRGYGASDQLADVLSTLCAYARVPATRIKLNVPGSRLDLALVRLDGRWCPLDPYRGVRFQHPDGRLASLEELNASPALLRSAYRGPQPPPLDYGRFMHPGLAVAVNSQRPYNQMPWQRAWQELGQRLHWLMQAVRGAPGAA